MNRGVLVRVCVVQILKRIFISVISCLSVILNLISDPSNSKAPLSKRLFYSIAALHFYFAQCSGTYSNDTKYLC